MEKQMNHEPAAERDAIRALFAKAEAREDWPAECCKLRVEAQRRLDVWKSNFPQSAQAEKIKRLNAAAAEQFQLAQRALIYDADGAFDAAERNRRHDDYVAAGYKLQRAADALAQE